MVLALALGTVQCRSLLFSAVLAALVPLSGCGNSIDPNVATQHNNNFRTGAFLAETELTPQIVQTRGMRQKYEFQVAGPVGTQPLYVRAVQFNRNTEQQEIANGLFVATLANRLYALDADTGKPRWCVILTDGPQAERSLHCDNPPSLGPNDRKPRGINSTPVIDVLNHRIYVLFSTKNQWPEWPMGGDCQSTPEPNQVTNLDVAYWLVALDIGDASLLSGTRIRATFPRSELHADPVVFEPKNQMDRPALLLNKNSLYVAFGSIAGAECRDDYNNYHGWVMRYRADDLTSKPAVFCTSADATKIDHTSGGAGIWQGGGGLAADADGNVYFLTGNGVADFGNNADPHVITKKVYGDSFIKLRPTANALVPTAFAPDDADILNEHDADLGSGGPMVIPDSNLVIGGGKTGYMYPLDRDSMQLVQPPITASTNQYGPSLRSQNWEVGPHLHGSPTFWRGADPNFGSLYVWGEKDVLKVYRVDMRKKQLQGFGRVEVAPFHKGTVRALADTMPGGMLSVSANQNTKHSGIVWATLPESDCTPGVFCPKPPMFPYPGRLYAYDAETLQWLWDMHLPNNLGHWVPPTVADGKVFIGTWTRYERSGDAQLIAYELGPEGGLRSGSCDDGISHCTREEPFQPKPSPAPESCTSCHGRKTSNQPDIRPLKDITVKPLHERYPNGASIRAFPAAAMMQLAPPDGSVETMVLEGDGLQIYEAAASATESRKLSWQLKGSEADLIEVRRAGRINHDSAEPIRVRLTEGWVWSAVDGTMIIGKLEKSAPAPESEDAPWTLFKVVKSNGHGILSGHSYVQIVHTHAGQAPVPTRRAGTIARVPFHAEYRFYRPGVNTHGSNSSQ